MARFALEAVHAAAAIPIRVNDESSGTVNIRAGFHSGPVRAKPSNLTYAICLLDFMALPYLCLRLGSVVDLEGQNPKFDYLEFSSLYESPLRLGFWLLKALHFLTECGISALLQYC